MKKHLFLIGIVVFGLIAIIVYTNDFAMTINEDTVKFKDRRIAIEYSEPKSSKKTRLNFVYPWRWPSE